MNASAKPIIQAGIEAAKAGDRVRALDLLRKAVEIDERSEQAWLWLSSVVETDADRRVCLENVLTINPQNVPAERGLKHLQTAGAGTALHPELYYTQGTIPEAGKIYIARQADGELYKNVLAGNLCYVLTARQMGKSSLMVQTRRRLQAANIRTAIVDLTKGSTDEGVKTIDAFYRAILRIISSELELKLNVRDWWEAQTDIETPAELFNKFLLDVVLTPSQQPVVIFIDEIDSVRSLKNRDLPVDGFFAVLRSIHNARATESIYRRLTFVLLGSARPSDLIDKSERTPFNIGVPIHLTYFTPEEALELTRGMNFPAKQKKAVVKWILEWTGGHPYLSQRVCSRLAQRGADSVIDRAVVEATVHELFFDKSKPDSNIKYIADNLLDRNRAYELIFTYYRLRSGVVGNQETESDEILEHLKLIGLIQGTQVSNRVYSTYFDRVWVADKLPRVSGTGITIDELEARFREENKAQSGKPDEERVETPFGSLTFTPLSKTVPASAYRESDLFPAREQRGREADQIHSEEKLVSFNELIEEADDEYLLSSPVNRRGSRVVDLMDEFEHRFDRLSSTRRRGALSRADVKLKLTEYYVLRIACMIGLFILGYVLFNQSVIIALVWGLVGLSLPSLYVLSVAKTREAAFQDQLPSTLGLWVNSLRAGYSVLQGIEAVSKDAPDPTATEFRRVAQEINLGIAMEDALERMGERIPTDDLDLALTAVNIQREVGGNLAEILEVISHTIRERIKLASEMRSILQTQPAVPFLLVFVLLIGQQIGVLYFTHSNDSPMGQVMQALSFLLFGVFLLINRWTSGELVELIAEVRSSSTLRRLLNLGVFVVSGTFAFAFGVPLVYILGIAVAYLFWRVIVVALVFVGVLLVVWLALNPQNIGIDVNQAAAFLQQVPVAEIAVVLAGIVLLGILLAFIYRRLTVNRDPLNERLAQYDKNEIPVSLEEVELSLSLKDRILAPLLRDLSNFALRFTPEGQIESARRIVNLSGVSINPTLFIILRFGLAAIFFALTILTFRVLGQASNISPVFGSVAAALVGYYLPAIDLRMKIARRKQKVLRALPDALDLLVICVEAGLGFDQSMGKVYEKWENELAVAFGRVLREIQLGKMRREALKDFDSRFEIPELSQFVAAIIQADQLGVSIAKMLRIQADTIRIQHRLRIQTRFNRIHDWQERAWNNLLPAALILWLIAPLTGTIFTP